MLRVKLGNVIRYANHFESIVDGAFEKFFGEVPTASNIKNLERALPLFNEWLIFDYKLKSGGTFLTEYFLRNPDKLSEDLLSDLKQIIDTQCFELLEIQSIKRGNWINVRGFYTNKTYTISDYRGSLTAPGVGIFWGRVSKVNNEYLLVGSDSLFFSVITTTRFKRLFSASKTSRFSPRDAIPILLHEA